MHTFERKFDIYSNMNKVRLNTEIKCVYLHNIFVFFHILTIN